MKVRILADTDNKGVKTPSGFRLENLPSDGKQMIHKDSLALWADYVTLSRGTLILHTVDGDVEFKIDQTPGRYCLTCDKRLPDNGPNGSDEEAKNAKACRDHVAEHGDDAEITERWPDGYQAHPKSFACTVVKSKFTETLAHG